MADELIRAVVVSRVTSSDAVADTVPVGRMADRVVEALRRDGRAVVVAPTGAGKTTVIPPALLDAGLTDKKIIVVQPRRVAARAAARYVAGQRGGEVGSEVGYWVRFDNRTTEGTRLTYATEGVLLRLFGEDPELSNIGALIFDEFHERTVFGDVGLALAKSLQSSTRLDLYLIVMSATLEVGHLNEYLGVGQIHVAQPVLTELVRSVSIPEASGTVVSNHRRYTVSVHYAPNHSVADILTRIAGEDGDVLIFQPGKREIAECIAEIRARFPDWYVLPLHGELPAEEQDRAFAPAPEGKRKVVVATNVAETSVTIPGIRFVVDTGTERVFEYDHLHGVGSLRLHSISKSSATQRAGRAGRTGDGVCYRLWSEEEHERRPAHRTPEIQRVDLSGVVLLLKSLGVEDVVGVDFLDHPGGERIRAAEETLHALGALDSDGRLTDVGQQMQRLPVDPHYGRMLVEAIRLGCVSEATTIAALMSVRRILLRPRDKQAEADKAHEPFRQVGREGQSDYLTLLAAYEAAREAGFSREFCRERFLHRRALLEARDVRRQIVGVLRRAGVRLNGEPASPETVRKAIAAGLADQLWRYDYGYYRHNGSTARLARESVLRSPDWLVAGEVREVQTRRGGTLTLITQAAAVEPGWLVEIAPQLVEVRYEADSLRYCPDGDYVGTTKITLFGGTEIAREYHVRYTGEGAVETFARALACGHVRGEGELVEVIEQNVALMREVRRLGDRNPNVPRLWEDHLAEWYLARIGEATSLAELRERGVDLRLTDADVSALLGVDWPALREETERLFPTEVEIGGHTVTLEYHRPYAHHVTAVVPAEILPEVTEDDIHAPPGYTMHYRTPTVYEPADTLDALRVVHAKRGVSVEWPNLPRPLLFPVEVQHPDGRVETVGYTGYHLGYAGGWLYTYPTAEKAAEETLQALTGRLVGQFKRPSEMYRDAWLVVYDQVHTAIRQVLESVPLPELPARWEEMAERARQAGEEVYQQGIGEYQAVSDTLAELREAVGAAEARFDSDEEADPVAVVLDELRGLASEIDPVDDLLYAGDVPAAKAQAQALRQRLGEIERLREQRLERLRGLRAERERVGALWDEIAGCYDECGLEYDEVYDARDALADVDLRTERWGRVRQPDLDAAASTLADLSARAEAALAERDARRERRARVQEAIAQHFTHCPLCGEELDDGQCWRWHDDGVLHRVDFPLDEDGEEQDAVLARIVTDGGESVAELRCASGWGRYSRGDVYLWVADVPPAFERLECDEVPLLDPFVAELRAKRQDVLEEIENLENELARLESGEEWARSGDYLGGSVFRAAFRQGEYKGKPEWFTWARHGGRSVKLVVAHRSLKPEDGRQYLAEVVRVLWENERSAGCLVRLHDERALHDEIAALRAEVEELDAQIAQVKSGEADTELQVQRLAAAWGARVRN